MPQTEKQRETRGARKGEKGREKAKKGDERGRSCLTSGMRESAAYVSLRRFTRSTHVPSTCRQREKEQKERGVG